MTGRIAMPRQKRVSRENMCHHVMLRGIDGRPTFIDDKDRVRFCLLLQEASELCSFRVHAFCLMTNHVHLMLEPTNESLTVGVHRFSGRYAQHFNRRHERHGYVFQGRFRSIVVEDGAYMRRLTRYIHLNPLEAGLVTHPVLYPWSSYFAYMEPKTVIAWLWTDRVLWHFGEKRSEALANMAVHLEARMEAEVDAGAIHKAFRVGAYGSEQFCEVFAPEGSELPARSRPHLLPDAGNMSALSSAVCSHFSVTLQELQSPAKMRQLVSARAVLARAAQLTPGLGLRFACETLGKPHGTMSRLATSARKDQQLDHLAKQLSTGLL